MVYECYVFMQYNSCKNTYLWLYVYLNNRAEKGGAPFLSGHQAMEATMVTAVLVMVIRTASTLCPSAVHRRTDWFPGIPKHVRRRLRPPTAVVHREKGRLWVACVMTIDNEECWWFVLILNNYIWFSFIYSSVDKRCFAVQHSKREQFADERCM